MENQTEERELTREELEQKKEEMYQFYTESLKYLKAQCEYEVTLANIEEARFKRTSIQMQYAMMASQQEDAMAGSTSPEELREEIQAEQKRKLRKD
jgi:hypothetical protein